MSDLVSYFESICATNGIYFSYGNRANQNLLRSDLTADKKYLLLDPLTRNKTFGELGGAGEVVYNSSFFLVQKSTIDKKYYNQSGEVDNGKYKEYILPILQNELSTIEGAINCDEYEIRTWTVVDAINVFDVNLDGVIVTFSIAIL